VNIQTIKLLSNIFLALKWFFSDKKGRVRGPGLLLTE